MVRVRVHPIDGSIVQSVIERLLMFDVDLCLDEADVEVVRQQHATLLEAGIAKVTASGDADQVFTFFNEMNTIELNGRCSMVLHDVLPSGENHGLANPVLESIWGSIESNIEADESHYQNDPPMTTNARPRLRICGRFFICPVFSDNMNVRNSSVPPIFPYVQFF